MIRQPKTLQLMKHILVFLIFVLVASCTEKQLTESEQLKAYYKGYKNANYESIRNVIADSLTTVYGDYTTTFTPEHYYEQFKWDSIFEPVYELVAIDEIDDQIIATVTMRSLKLEFLKNNPMTCQYQFQFTSGKISRIEELDCNDANWKVWKQEVDTLVDWVKINHPELDGFIHDLSMQGAIDYVKAIELYENRDLK